MSRRRQKTRKNRLNIEFMVYEQDLSCEQPVNSVAMRVMACLEGRVSEGLLEILKEMLLGFNEVMQLEIADDLLDFACSRVVKVTNCVSADAVLESCYEWIAAEKGWCFNIHRHK